MRQTQQARLSASTKCSINLPFPHFAHAELAASQRSNWLRQTKNLACFTVWVSHKFEGENAHLPTTQNEWPEKSKKIELLNLPELHNARLRGWQRNAELKKHTVNTELQFCTKTAKRWQSLLSRLLCKFNKINWLYSFKSHHCNGWVIQEPTQARAMINKPPKQSPPFNKKPSFWMRQTQQARLSANAKWLNNLPFPHFAPT